MSVSLSDRRSGLSDLRIKNKFFPEDNFQIDEEIHLQIKQ